MFGGKQIPGPVTPSRARYKYMVEDFVGKGAFNKGVNALAADGWEVVNASFNGVAHHVYLQREIIKPS